MKRLPYILLTLLLSCSENDPGADALENEMELDCGSLRIRKVELIKFMNAYPHEIHVTMENTCQNCKDTWVYLNLLMIDKKAQDTIASSNCFCLVAVKNRSTGIYKLSTERETLPDLKNVTFSYPYLCNDVPYEPHLNTFKKK